jgi:hypothetical protein
MGRHNNKRGKKSNKKVGGCGCGDSKNSPNYFRNIFTGGKKKPSRKRGQKLTRRKMVGGNGFMIGPTTSSLIPTNDYYPFNTNAGTNLDLTSTTEISQINARNAAAIMTPGSIFVGGSRRRRGQMSKKIRFSKRKRIYGGSGITTPNMNAVMYPAPLSMVGAGQVAALMGNQLPTVSAAFVPATNIGGYSSPLA